ncbi:MAG: hypothetical protein ACREK7_04485 [Gemmatimonadota bacterium]
MDGRLAPLLNSPVAPMLVAVLVAMMTLVLAAHRWRLPWAGLVLRLLAVAGFVLPGWTAYRWYRSLAGARDAAASLPVDPEPVIESFVASTAALMIAGFALLLGGIHLAGRVRAGGREGGAP